MSGYNHSRRRFLSGVIGASGALALGPMGGLSEIVKPQTSHALEKKYDPDEQVRLYRLNRDGTLTDVTEEIVRPLSEGLPEGRGIVKKLARYNVWDSSGLDFIVGQVQKPDGAMIWRVLPPYSSAAENIQPYLQNKLNFSPYGIPYIKVEVTHPNGNRQIYNFAIFEKLVETPEGTKKVYIPVSLDTGFNFGGQTSYVEAAIGGAKKFQGITTKNDERNLHPGHDTILTQSSNSRWSTLPNGRQGTLDEIIEHEFGIPAEGVRGILPRVNQVIAIKRDGPNDGIYLLTTNRNYGGTCLSNGNNSPVNVFQNDIIGFHVEVSGPFPYTVKWKGGGVINPNDALIGHPIPRDNRDVSIQFPVPGTFSDTTAIITFSSLPDVVIKVHCPPVNVLPSQDSGGTPGSGGAPPPGGGAPPPLGGG